MTYSFTNTTTRPANVEWFKDAEPIGATALHEWTRSQPGFVSFKKVVMSSTTVINTYTFDTRENFNAYRVASELNENFIARKLYNEQNNITTVGQGV
jgi:hypothetical protein